MKIKDSQENLQRGKMNSDPRSDLLKELARDFTPIFRAHDSINQCK